MCDISYRFDRRVDETDSFVGHPFHIVAEVFINVVAEFTFEVQSYPLMIRIENGNGNEIAEIPNRCQ